MRPFAEIPLEVCPKVVSAWRSVHTGPKPEAFVVEGLWGVHLYRYAADVEMDGQLLRIENGHAGFTPPGARMDYRFQGVCAHVFAHVFWPDDALPVTALPLMFPTGARFEALWSRLEEAIAFRGTPRCDVRVWDVVLELAEIAAAPRASAHEAVGRALAFIEAHLADPISAGDVADAAWVSHNHLCRLFQKHLGQTVMAAIRDRRVERARHLLAHTTLSIKEVAAQVGIDDLQRFNKTVRMETGLSPTRLRRFGSATGASPLQ